MIKCDRCGKPIKNPCIVRYSRKIGMLNSFFNIRMDDFELCPKCADSFRKWLWMKRIS